VTRDEVLEHCAHYGIKYRTDSSNLTADFTRNRVRQELLPLLRTFNPQVGSALLRGAGHWQADAECLDEMAREHWQRACVADRLDTRELADVPAALRHRVMRLWLEGQIGLSELTQRHWQALERLATQGQSGRKVELPCGWRVQREFDMLRLWQASVDDSQIHLVPVRLTTGQALSFGAYDIEVFPLMAKEQAETLRNQNQDAQCAMLNAEVQRHPLWVRTRQPGDAYVPIGRKSPVKLKTLLIRGRVPVRKRMQHPLLLVGDEIAWSPGLQIASTFSLPETQAECVLVIARERCNLSVPACVIPKVAPSG
jgi:tRNA(Ile)-lysidine synthase